MAADFPSGRRHIWLALSVAVFSAAADQLHKWVMLDLIRIAGQPPVEVNDFFNLVMVWNRGVSFGLFADYPRAAPYVFSTLSLAIVAVLLRWAGRVDCRPTAIGIGLVVGGALGNVIDRLRFGAVADFFDFHLAGWHWPAFNIADSLIFCGVVLIGIMSFRHESRSHACDDPPSFPSS